MKLAARVCVCVCCMLLYCWYWLRSAAHCQECSHQFMCSLFKWAEMPKHKQDAQGEEETPREGLGKMSSPETTGGALSKAGLHVQYIFSLLRKCSANNCIAGSVWKMQEHLMSQSLQMTMTVACFFTVLIPVFNPLSNNYLFASEPNPFLPMLFNDYSFFPLSLNSLLSLTPLQWNMMTEQVSLYCNPSRVGVSHVR